MNVKKISRKVEAQLLVDCHTDTDKELIKAFFFPEANKDSINLLEISSDMPTAMDAEPFTYPPDSSTGTDRPIKIIILSEKEFEAVKNKNLKLPSKWRLNEAIELKIRRELSDTEMIDILEKKGVSLISDDSGHWCVTGDGMQNIPKELPGDIETTFIIKKKEWKKSIREAMKAFMKGNRE